MAPAGQQNLSHQFRIALALPEYASRWVAMVLVVKVGKMGNEGR
jgi:hypothetical protein